MAHSDLGLKTVIGGKDCEAVTETPSNGSGFKIGNISVKALYTPCHTQDSICWFMEDGNEKVVFTGDTLFHGGMFSSLLQVGSILITNITGCGRFFEGTPEQMHVALNKTLADLPGDTKVYVRGLTNILLWKS